MAKIKTDIPKAAEGNVLLLAPDGATGCAVDGVEYVVNDGFCEVDQAHAATLIESHGYVAAE
ncbi:hypothetical protein [Geothrix campi]|uniref:hypothetical protein n=1 Tax=Geothrix campi TaxID=2966450 RepID=UPI0021476972|nr:hypothetical protein [Geothrix sp. SG10]